MGMFDDVFINKKELTCLTDDEKNMLGKKDTLHFQTKSLENWCYTFEIMNGKIYRLKNKMAEFRPDISNYNIRVYNYIDLGDLKYLDCELKIHIKEGEVQEISKEIFKIEESIPFKFPEYHYKFGYKFLNFLASAFSSISSFFRQWSFKRRTIKEE